MIIKFRCLEIVWRVSAEHVGIYCNVVNDILRLKLFSIQKHMSEIQSQQIETMHCIMFEENSLERPSSSSHNELKLILNYAHVFLDLRGFNFHNFRFYPFSYLCGHVWI